MSTLVSWNHPDFHSSLALPSDENPVMATTIPITVIPINATNLKTMKLSPTRVANLVEIQFTKITTKSPVKATAFTIQGLS